MKQWQHYEAGTTVDAPMPRWKRASQENLKERSVDSNVDSQLQIELKEDGSGTECLAVKI